MSCMRHSYPRGSKPGSGRKCNRCDHLDLSTPEAGSSAPVVTTPAADTVVVKAESQSFPSDQGSTPAASDDATTLPSLAAPVPATLSTLPEHSPLGASSSERWVKCPGSVALTKLVRASDMEEDDPDYRRDGVEAHALGAWCLENEADCWEAPTEQFPSLTEGMMAAVQKYVDFCRTLPSRVRFIEHKMHRPEFHPDAYGTGDYIAVSVISDVLDFVDYKHGEGVPVEVVGNTQLQYYVYLFIGEDRDEYPDEMTVRVRICQPRIPYEGNDEEGQLYGVRTWEVRAGTVRAWARDTLRPAMERTANERWLSVGEWCRFCPAKIVCPAMACLSDELVHKVEKHDPEKRVRALDNNVLAEWYAKAQAVKMYVKAIEAETERRVLNAEAIYTAKAVNRKSWRVWKPDVPLRDKFGEAAFAPKTPAQIEELPDGKTFVAEWAFNANLGKLTVAPITDSRKAVEVKTGEGTFGAAVANLVDNNPVEEVY